MRQGVEPYMRNQKNYNKPESKQLKMKIKKRETVRVNFPRREALKKAGMYAAFTAMTSLMFLMPKKAQADSPVDPGWG